MRIDIWAADERHHLNPIASELCRQAAPAAFGRDHPKLGASGRTGTGYLTAGQKQWGAQRPNCCPLPAPDHPLMKVVVISIVNWSLA